jgi:hypothetical protein
MRRQIKTRKKYCKTKLKSKIPTGQENWNIRQEPKQKEEKAIKILK